MSGPVMLNPSLQQKTDTNFDPVLKTAPQNIEQFKYRWTSTSHLEKYEWVCMTFPCYLAGDMSTNTPSNHQTTIGLEPLPKPKGPYWRRRYCTCLPAPLHH